MLATLRGFYNFVLKTVQNRDFWMGIGIKKKGGVHLNIFITLSKSNLFEEAEIKSNNIVKHYYAHIKLLFCCNESWIYEEVLIICAFWCILCATIFKNRNHLYLYLTNCIQITKIKLCTVNGKMLRVFCKILVLSMQLCLRAPHLFDKIISCRKTFSLFNDI